MGKGEGGREEEFLNVLLLNHNARRGRVYIYICRKQLVGRRGVTK